MACHIKVVSPIECKTYKCTSCYTTTQEEVGSYDIIIYKRIYYFKFLDN